MSGQTYLIYDKATNTYTTTDFDGYNRWLNGLDLTGTPVPGSPTYLGPASTSSVSFVGGNDNYSMSDPSTNTTSGYQVQIQPGDGTGAEIFQQTTTGTNIGDQERIDTGGPGVLELSQLRLSSIDIVQDVSYPGGDEVDSPIITQGEPSGPLTAAQRAQLEEDQATADALALTNAVWASLSGWNRASFEEDAETGGYPEVTTDTPYVSTQTSNNTTTDSDQTVSNVTGYPDNSAFGGLTAEETKAIDRTIIVLASGFSEGAVFESRTSIENVVQASTQAAELLDYFGDKLTSEDRKDLEAIVNAGRQVAQASVNVQEAVGGAIESLRAISLYSEDETPNEIASRIRNQATSVYESLTRDEKMVLRTLFPELDNQLSALQTITGGQNPFVSADKFQIVPYTAQSFQPLGSTDAEVDRAVAAWIAQNGNISEAEYARIEAAVLDSRGTTLQREGVSQDQGPRIDNEIRFASATAESEPSVRNDALTIEDINFDPLGVADPTLVQNLLKALDSPKDTQRSVSSALAEYFGVENPLGTSAIDRAVRLAANQLPGVSEINRAAGTVRTLNNAATTLTSDNLSAQDLAYATLSILALANPQAALLLRALDFLGLKPGPAVTQSSTVVPGDVGGGGGGVNELVEQTTAAPVDPQAATAGGGGDFGDEFGDDFGFDAASIFSEETAVSDQEDPAAAAADQAEDTQDQTTVSSQTNEPVGNFSAVYNVETGNYDVYDLETNDVVYEGLSYEAAREAADALSRGDADAAADAVLRYQIDSQDIKYDAETVTEDEDPNLYPHGLPYDDDGNLMPGWSLDENGDPVWVGDDFVEPATSQSAEESRIDAARIQTLKNNANAQATREAQRGQAALGDWRVKLRLAEGADYLYRDPRINENGLLWPLAVTNGVVFPYTPTINTNYGANYSSYDLTHANYRGYFYQNSYVDEVAITATFTAQDTTEANYLLAVIHFFKSVTKMFYGQDANRGQPPPLVFLQGLGEFQFNLHPCVVRNFSYNLPADVDYIRARVATIDGTNLLARRDRATTSSSPSWFSNLRLNSAGLNLGGLVAPPAPPTLGTTSPTYVPTKIEINLTLLPIQSRSQVSKQFSLKQYANGDLLKGGFW